MVTTVAMAHPVINQDKSIKLRYRDRCNPSLCLEVGLSLALVCLPIVVQSADWDGSASLALSEIYSDNIRLSVADEESESITTITPGISLKGQGARLKLDLSYSMQNLFYAQNPDRNRINHQLQASEQGEVIKDLFYFDSNASISQQLTNPSEYFSQDNLNLSGQRDDVVTLQVEPYLKRTLGSYATAELRYLHGWVDYDATGVSDAESSIVSAYLTNGNEPTKLSWYLSYRQQNDIRDTGPDSERRSSSATISYRVMNTLSLVGYAGREDNNIQTSRASVNGSYWSAGFNWQPGPKFSLEATTGENYDQVQLNWNPMTRTSVNIGYSDRDVGLNTSASWLAQISHRTRRSTWAFDYSEAVTNAQQLALIDRTFLGNVENPDTGEIVPLFLDTYDITDGEFLRTRAQASVNYKTGKSNISLLAYNELRTYEVSGDELASEGGNISWRWQFASRTSSTISVNGQRFDVFNSADRRQNMTSRVSLARRLSSRMNTRVELSRYEVNTDNGSSETIVENRLGAYLNMSF